MQNNSFYLQVSARGGHSESLIGCDFGTILYEIWSTRYFMSHYIANHLTVNFSVSINIFGH